MDPIQGCTVSTLLELLLDPRQYERPPLLVSRLVDCFRILPREDGVAFFEQELGNVERSLHFQYVLLQAAADLSWPELQDILKRYVLSDVPIQLVKAAMRAIAAAMDLSVYCFCLELQSKCSRQELVDLAGEQIGLLMRENRTIQIFHDVVHGFVRHRDPFTGLDQLAAHVDRLARERLVPALRQLNGMELAVACRLAGLCGQHIFSGPLLDRLRRDWDILDADVLKEMIWALCRSAGSGQRRERIGRSLELMFSKTRPELKELVYIWSLPLLDLKYRKALFSRFPSLKAEEKAVLLLDDSRENGRLLAPYVLDGLDWENDEALFEQYVGWLIERGYVRQCLDRLGALSGPRMRLLLCALCRTDCGSFVDELLPFFHAGVEDDVLECLSKALLGADVGEPVAKRAWELMRSGVSPLVQSALIRRLPHWLHKSGALLDEVFAICQNTVSLHQEWLVTWSRILNSSPAESVRLNVLDGVLVLFERMVDTDPLPYIAFFRGITYQSREELRLVREEVSLILNTILRSAASPDAGQQLSGLLRELEKKEQSDWPQHRDR